MLIFNENGVSWTYMVQVGRSLCKSARQVPVCTFTGDLTQCQCCRFGASWSWCQCWFKAVLLSQNYLFLAPTTAPAIYWHLKPYFYQGSEPACFVAAQAPKKKFPGAVYSSSSGSWWHSFCAHFFSVVDPDPHGSGIFAWIWVRNYSSGSKSSKTWKNR